LWETGANDQNPDWGIETVKVVSLERV